MFKLMTYGIIAAVSSFMLMYALLTSDTTLNEVQSASVEKITSSMLDDLEKAMPLIEEAGYTMDSVEAELSLPPELKTVFKREKVVEPEKQDRIVAALDNNRIGQLVLKLLIQTFSFDKKVSVKDMDLESIHIVISFPPYVVAEYSK
jgi:hypothetical protein